MKNEKYKWKKEAEHMEAINKPQEAMIITQGMTTKRTIPVVEFTNLKNLTMPNLLKCLFLEIV